MSSCDAWHPVCVVAACGLNPEADFACIYAVSQLKHVVHRSLPWLQLKVFWHLAIFDEQPRRRLWPEAVPFHKVSVSQGGGNSPHTWSISLLELPWFRKDSADGAALLYQEPCTALVCVPSPSFPRTPTTSAPTRLTGSRDDWAGNR